MKKGATQIKLLPSPRRVKTSNKKCSITFGTSPIGHTLDVKPVSVNECWQGRRFKTDTYKRYEKMLLYQLPAMTMPAPPYRITFEFGFSNRASDWDNPCKPLQDILQKKYHFDDKDIYEAVIRKKIVEKGKEYISFVIETLTQ